MRVRIEAALPVISRRTVICLGMSQLVCWGISYYLIGVFADQMTADLGWSRSLVYGGFSAALVTMGVVSPLVGKAIDRRGGRPVMAVGSAVMALGCFAIAVAHDPMPYYAAWIALGVSMRMTLYDAAFATLARLGGAQAKRPISQITLLGGLASTAFWPIGHYFAEAVGWRGAVVAYGIIALLTMPLHLAIDRAGAAPPAAAEAPGADSATPPAGGNARALAAVLYALIVTLMAFLNSGLSAHMLGMMTGLGMAAAAAVWISTLRGIGQTSARLCEVLFGARLHPVVLTLLATGILPVGFLIGLLSGQFAAAGMAFALMFGAGNGLMTIARGTLPLALFDVRTYGSLVGRLLVPSFLLSALAPLVYALVIERFGNAATFYMSALIAALMFGAALVLRWRFGRRPKESR